MFAVDEVLIIDFDSDKHMVVRTTIQDICLKKKK